MSAVISRLVCTRLEVPALISRHMLVWFSNACLLVICCCRHIVLHMPVSAERMRPCRRQQAGVDAASVPAVIGRHMHACLPHAYGCNGYVLQTSVSVERILPADISGLVWTRLGQPRGCLLGVRRADGPTINFLGFKDKVRASNSMVSVVDVVWQGPGAFHVQWARGAGGPPSTASAQRTR